MLEEGNAVRVGEALGRGDPEVRQEALDVEEHRVAGLRRWPQTQRSASALRRSRSGPSDSSDDAPCSRRTHGWLGLLRVPRTPRDRSAGRLRGLREARVSYEGGRQARGGGRQARGRTEAIALRGELGGSRTTPLLLLAGRSCAREGERERGQRSLEMRPTTTAASGVGRSVQSRGTHSLPRAARARS